MSDHEITLDEAIEFMDAQAGELATVTGVCLYAADIRDYLKEYKAQQETARYEGRTMAKLTDVSSDNGRIIHRRKWVCQDCYHDVMRNDAYCSHCGKKIVEWVK